MNDAHEANSNFFVSALKNKEQRDRIQRSSFPLIGLVFIVVFFQLTTKGRLLTTRNLNTVFNQAFTTLLGTCGVAFVISQGNLDFSVGAVSGVAAVFAAKSAGAGPLVSLLVALATGLVIGTLNGLIHVGFKAPANIVTLCTQFTFRGVIQVVAVSGLFIPLSWSWIDSLKVKLIVAVVIVIITILIFEYTKVGKFSKAVGSNSLASIQSGVPMYKMRVIAFMLSGLAAGLCGFFSMVRAGSVAPTTGTALEMDILLALVLGGMPLSGGATSKIRSAIIGSAMLAFLSNGLIIWGINDNVQQGVKGIIFLIAVAISFERENIAVIK